MYGWDGTWDQSEVETIETKLYDLCNDGKNFIFTSGAKTRVKSSKQFKISTNGLFQSDLRNRGSFPDRFRRKSILAANTPLWYNHCISCLF